MSSTEDSSVTSTEDPSYEYVIYLSIYQLCHLLKIAVLPVLKKLPATSILYTEAFISYVIC